MDASLGNFRSKFAVAQARADFHLWPNELDGAHNVAARIGCDAVTAVQRRFRSERSQNSFQAREALTRLVQ